MLCLLTFPFIAVVPDRISAPSSKDSQRVDGFYRFVWRRSVSQYSVDYGIIALLIRRMLRLELRKRQTLALQILVIGPQFIRLNSVLHKHNIILKREAKRLAFGIQKLSTNVALQDRPPANQSVGIEVRRRLVHWPQIRRLVTQTFLMTIKCMHAHYILSAYIHRAI